jgi:F-type H+-transporting ATPase subunit epsilon
MCAPVAGPFYRAAGMSYLKYANICADLMRNVMKEPHKTKAAARSIISFRSSQWVDGVQGKPGELLHGINTQLLMFCMSHDACVFQTRRLRSCKGLRHSCVICDLSWCTCSSRHKFTVFLYTQSSPTSRTCCQRPSDLHLQSRIAWTLEAAVRWDLGLLWKPHSLCT